MDGDRIQKIIGPTTEKKMFNFQLWNYLDYSVCKNLWIFNLMTQKKEKMTQEVIYV